MSEPTMIWMFAVAMVFLSIGSVLYSMGGYSGKWKRRFVGSFILSLGFNGLCAWRGLWNPWLLATFPALIGTFCLPYGAETTFPKVIKRTCVVIAAVGSGVIFCITHPELPAWKVLIPHLCVGICSIYMGAVNPIKARAEEGFICLLLTLGLYMYPFI